MSAIFDSADRTRLATSIGEWIAHNGGQLPPAHAIQQMERALHIAPLSVEEIIDVWSLVERPI